MKNNFKFLVGAAFALSLFVVSSASAAYMHTTTLKLGSRNTQVMALQQTLNMTSCKVAATGNAGSMGMETTYFGPATNAAVKCFQLANGTTADGIVGPMTGAKLVVVSNGSVSGNFPAGCTSAAGYSSTTGNKCSSTPSTPTSGDLQGGAGDLTLSSTSTDVEDDVEEGKTEKVFGLEAEADDSDIAITNVKVSITAVSGAYSTRIERYLDEVSVWLGDKKVGSVDADEFSKDGSTYTKSISLSGAVIREDDEENLYVGVTALNNVDDDAQTFTVGITDVRYTDATGAILSATSNSTNVFGFDEQGIDDELTVKSSSANPDSTTLRVNEDSKSDDFLVLAFNLDVDDKSSDIDVNEFPVVITVSSGTISSVINEVYVKVGSKEYTGDRTGSGTGTTSTFVVNFDDNFTIDSGDMEEVKVYVVFNKQSGNYSTGTTVSASVAGTAIDATGADDLTSGNLSGTASGKTHSLEIDAPMFDLKSKSFALSQAIDGVTAGTEDIFLAKFTFEVTADEEDIYLPFNTTTGTGSVSYNITGATSASSVILDSADSEIEENVSYKVAAGSTEEFTLSFYVRGNDTSAKIEIVGFGTATADQTTRTATVTSGLTDFKTNSVYIAK